MFLESFPGKKLPSVMERLPADFVALYRDKLAEAARALRQRFPTSLIAYHTAATVSTAEFPLIKQGISLRITLLPVARWRFACSVSGHLMKQSQLCLSQGEAY